MKNSITFFCLLLMANGSYCQQEALYSQYLYNPLILNPAVAGSDDALSMMVFHRSQWLGFEGAPSTQTFSVHNSFGAKASETKPVGLGLHVVNDNIGPNSSVGTYGSVAYRLKISDGMMCAGIRGGLLRYSINWNSIDYNNSAEPHQKNIENRIIPGFDFGMHYYTKMFFIGSSVSNLTQPKLAMDNAGNKIAAHLSRHWILTSGYRFKIKESLELKPSFILRYVKNSPIGLDINTNFLLYSKFCLGVGYRLGYGAVLSSEYKITENLRLGYSYDASLNKVRSSIGGSHEIFIGYKFDKRKKPELPEIPDSISQPLALVPEHQSVDTSKVLEKAVAVKEDTQLKAPPAVTHEEKVEEIPAAQTVKVPVAEIRKPVIEEVIVSATKNKKNSYTYKYYPVNQAKLFLLNEDEEIMQTAESNEAGFLKFKNTTTEENHLFRLDADRIEKIDRILVILIDEEGNEKMVFAPKLKNNLYRYESVSEEEEESILYVLDNTSGDTLMAAPVGRDGSFVFKESPATENYRVVLDTKEPEEFADVNIKFGEEKRITVENKDVAVSSPPSKQAEIQPAKIKNDPRVEPTVEMIAGSPELVRVHYINDKGNKEEIIFTRKEVDFDKGYPKLSDDSEKLYVLNEDGDTLQEVSINQDGFFEFDNLPEDADLDFKMEEMPKNKIRKEIKVAIKGMPIQKAVMAEEGNNFELKPLNEEEMTNLTIKESNDIIPDLEKSEENVLTQAFNNIEFDLNSHALQWSSYETINELALLLNTNPDWKLKLGGHTDETGSSIVNLILSRKRVETIKEYLTRRRVNPDQIILKYFGERYPIADNFTEEGKRKNRRVELLLIKNKE